MKKHRIYSFLRSSIVQGVVLGWAALILILVSVVLAGRLCQVTDLNIIFNIRVGLLLTITTVITRVITFIIAFMLPAILAGIFSFNKVPDLNGSAKKIGQLMNASMSPGLLSTGKACFNCGPIRKISVTVALALVCQYIISAADLYIHLSAIGISQKAPGPKITGTRALNIANNCSEDRMYYYNTCGLFSGLAGSVAGVTYPVKSLEVYKNVSKTLQIWRADGGVYLLQSPPEKAYEYTGSGIFLKPSCEAISSTCKLTELGSSALIYSCPSSLWSVNGIVDSSTIKQYNVNITSVYYDRINEKSIASNPIHVIVSAKYSLGTLESEDPEFVSISNGDFGILMHCQIYASTVEYVVTLGSLKATLLGNLTNAQLLAVGYASKIMSQYAIDDTVDVAFQGNSSSYLDAFSQQFAQATIASFVGAVQENGEGYDYVLEVDDNKTSIPFHVILIYAIVIILPVLIFSIVSIHSFRNQSAGILAEFICVPQRLFYQVLIKNHYEGDSCLDNLAVQEDKMIQYKCNIEVKEHLEFHVSN
ncbi:19482_t:CDS:1 [Dentiscutata erythropus]|uniref:19482_t:CDS:1 n=1 Tax=Dentiscutata erythropus TaxID=1348616 RepID=A0A9N9DL96_9GLOM|nr:19482_t:CDS:1 [Dentiscutata erythropus]